MTFFYNFESLMCMASEKAAIFLYLLLCQSIQSVIHFV